MSHSIAKTATLLLAALLLAGCGRDSRGDGSGGDGDDDDGSDTDTGDVYDGPAGTLQGTVMAPSGEFPISGALVYLTKFDAPEIPDSIYCYECEDMTGKKWTLSNADGSWSMDNVPVGDWNLVVRKGFFQRQRTITVETDQDLQVPLEHTTLPSDNSSDGLDQIPNYAVLLSYPDEAFNLLAKFGLGETSGGDLVFGTEKFDAFNDDVVQSGYPSSTELFYDQETLDHYHMIFLPCYASATGVAFVDQHAEMIRSYVSAGGKIYNSCCVSYWTERPFPAYIDLYGADEESRWDVGRLFSTAHDSTGTINDPDLREWLEVVLPSADPDHVPFVNGYTKIDALVPTDDGHGLEEDDFVVTPYSWVDGSAGDEYQGSPLMATYNYDCGKIFYSVYETSPDSGDQLIPQEYVLLYIILEVGVCEGDYTVE